MECDIELTGVLAELFRTPKEQRDETWQENFLKAAPRASFACRDPQVLVGPDGFPYFALYIPEPGQAFESFCIQNLSKDFLMENGVGVAINPGPEGVDWVFSYGDIMNWDLNGEFYSPVVQPQSPRDEEPTSLLIAHPSETYLPMKTRQVLKAFLKQNSVANPKVFLLTQTTELDIMESLVFNLFEEDFETTEAFNTLMQRLTWFLPKHYFLSRVPNDPSWTTYFSDL